MGERTRYTAGTFSWVELATTDKDAEKRFYSELFGWQMTDNPVGEGVVYTMGSVGGKYVGAISPQPSQQREAGAPPMWNSYITVQSADEALEEARQLGGTVHAPAFDVFSAGRMGVIKDPQGAYIMVWQPGDHIGAGLVNTHGALCWNELATPDMEASANFYSRLFGWSTESVESPGPPYLVIKNRDGWSNGGIRQAASTEPCYWLVYFAVDDLEPALGRVQDLGGSSITDVMEMWDGRFAAVQDPQGAVFALYAGRFDD